MSETMNKITKDSIRGQLNLIYSMMKYLSVILDLALENEMARASLSDTAECLFNQAAILFRDISTYTEALADDSKRVLQHG